MVIKKAKYSKEFISRKSEINPHNNNFNQITANEDDNLRSKIQKKFDVIGTNGGGFDGKQMYHYDVIGNPNTSINHEQEVKYKTNYYIKKAGTLEEISKNCELEDFLLEKGFKKE